jgi:beta-galactosidase
LYVWFHDWNNDGRRGAIDFEGRKTVLGQHFEANGRWVKLLVMREDTLDGKLVLMCSSVAGPNLYVRAVVFVVDS